VDPRHVAKGAFTNERMHARMAMTGVTPNGYLLEDGGERATSQTSIRLPNLSP
jgi:hypothetical protein